MLQISFDKCIWTFLVRNTPFEVRGVTLIHFLRGLEKDKNLFSVKCTTLIYISKSRFTACLTLSSNQDKIGDKN